MSILNTNLEIKLRQKNVLNEVTATAAECICSSERMWGSGLSQQSAATLCCSGERADILTLTHPVGAGRQKCFASPVNAHQSFKNFLDVNMGEPWLGSFGSHQAIECDV